MATFGRVKSIAEVRVTATGAVSTATFADWPGQCVVKTFRPDAGGMESEGLEKQAGAFLERAGVQQQVAGARAPHWAPIHECGAIPGGAYYVSNWYPSSVERLIAQRAKMTAGELHALMTGACRGLSELKTVCGRAHGNVKPANVLLDRGGARGRWRVFLSDPADADAVEGGDAEAADLRALGQILHELVMHAKRGGDAGPAAASRAWNSLGSSGAGWRKLCNDLLGSGGAERITRLEDLRKRLAKLAPQGAAAVIWPTVAAVTVIIVLAAEIFWLPKLPHGGATDGGKNAGTRPTSATTAARPPTGARVTSWPAVAVENPLPGPATKAVATTRAVTDVATRVATTVPATTRAMVTPATATARASSKPAAATMMATTLPATTRSTTGPTLPATMRAVVTPATATAPATTRSVMPATVAAATTRASSKPAAATMIVTTLPAATRSTTGPTTAAVTTLPATTRAVVTPATATAPATTRSVMPATVGVATTRASSRSAATTAIVAATLPTVLPATTRSTSGPATTMAAVSAEETLARWKSSIAARGIASATLRLAWDGVRGRELARLASPDAGVKALLMELAQTLEDAERAMGEPADLEGWVERAAVLERVAATTRGVHANGSARVSGGGIEGLKEGIRKLLDERAAARRRERLLAEAQKRAAEEDYGAALAAADEVERICPADADAATLRSRIAAGMALPVYAHRTYVAEIPQNPVKSPAAVHPAPVLSERDRAIAELLGKARDIDVKERWRPAIVALDELLKLDPGNAEGLRLGEKIGVWCPPPADELTLPLGQGVRMHFVLIRAGRFTMGSPAGEKGRDENEPQRPVVITRAFYMGVTPVTQEQYAVVMRQNPSWFQGDRSPVETVSWQDAAMFCQKVSMKARMLVCLPTEAQWEYACRAGTTTPYYTGETAAALAEAGWYDGNSRNQTHAVGLKKPNAWGLYDMLGNVRQWCSDWYEERPAARLAIDPAGPPSGKLRVACGGSMGDFASRCRAASRYGCGADYRCFNLGFRASIQGLDLFQQSALAIQEAVERQRKIVRFMDAARQNDRPETAATALALLDELLKIDPGNAEAARLARKIRARLVPPAKEMTVSLGRGVTMRLALVPAGRFMMGSAADEIGRDIGETAHAVTIGRPFYMAVTPVTVEQYNAIMGGYDFDEPASRRPVTWVSWHDAAAFCRALSRKIDRDAHLPTEAQWEYGCRAGTATAYNTGDGAEALGQAGWYAGNSLGQAHAVGQKKPNAWGLQDMHGNVWEWCADWYGPYGAEDATDPTGPAADVARIVRGGSWCDDAAACRSAARGVWSPDGRSASIGMRVVIEVE